jgi:hypothetical protein
MEDYFELPITYKGEELLLKGRLAAFTYVYKFYIMVNDSELEFERDDNGEFFKFVSAWSMRNIRYSYMRVL